MNAALSELFALFFKVGLFSFGGGYTILSVIQNELTSRGWLTVAEYSQVVTISQMTPGPLAVNAATYVGAKLYLYNMWESFVGAFVATFAVCLPSFLIVLIVARFLKQFNESQAVKYIMSGIRPSIIGFMLVATFIFGRLSFLKVFEQGFVLENLNPIGIVLFIFATYLHSYRGMSAIKLMLFCGILGLIFM